MPHLHAAVAGYPESDLADPSTLKPQSPVRNRALGDCG
jgi:hypothetical protein